MLQLKTEIRGNKLTLASDNRKDSILEQDLAQCHIIVHRYSVIS
jgi:hypothetical protein